MTSLSNTVRSAPDAAASADRYKALFLVTAPADPQMLSRLVEPAAKLGHIPDRVHASREAGDRSEMTVDMRLSGVPHRTAELLEYGLRSVYGVRQVLAVIEPDHA